MFSSSKYFQELYFLSIVVFLRIYKSIGCVFFSNKDFRFQSLVNWRWKLLTIGFVTCFSFQFWISLFSFLICFNSCLFTFLHFTILVYKFFFPFQSYFNSISFTFSMMPCLCFQQFTFSALYILSHLRFLQFNFPQFTFWVIYFLQFTFLAFIISVIYFSHNLRFYHLHSSHLHFRFFFPFLLFLHIPIRQSSKWLLTRRFNCCVKNYFHLLQTNHQTD